MSDLPSDLQVVHNPDKSRFEVALDGELALVQYNLAGSNIIYTHTEVPIAFEGKGIGSKLARHVLDYARDNGLKVQALCPFINNYVRKHPEYHSITWGY